MEIAGPALRVDNDIACENVGEQHDTLRQVFVRGAAALYRFILFRIGGKRDLADDLLQQTCYEAARHRCPPSNLDDCEAWMRGIARNLIRRHWRNLRRQADWLRIDDAALAGQLVDDLESRPLPPDTLVKKEAIEQLLLAITSLAAADQDLIFGFYFEGRSQVVLARDLGLTEKSVESRLYRARGCLRGALRQMERSDER